jgi:spore coat protein U-like protein
MIQMKKLVRFLLVAATLAVAAMSSAQAATAVTPATFNVRVTLTPSCSISTPSDVQFTYTSFQAAVANSTGGAFNVTCTNSLPVGVTFSGTPAGGSLTTGAATTSGTFTATNLNYSLAIPAIANGNGAAQAYSITGTMAGGQAGTCAGPAACNDTISGVTLTATF